MSNKTEPRKRQWNARPDDVVPLWEAVCTAREAGKWSDREGDDEWRLSIVRERNNSACVVRSRSEDIHHPDKGLGIACRLLLLIGHFGINRKQQSLFKMAWAKSGRPENAMPSITSLMRIPQLGNEHTYTNDIPLGFQEGFENWVKETNPAATAQMLFGDTYSGRNAVRMYRRLLGNLEPTLQPLLGEKRLDPSGERFAKPLQDMVKLLTDEDECVSTNSVLSPGVVELVMGSLPSSQRMFASALVQKLEDIGEQRPVIVIPIKGDPIRPVTRGSHLVPTTPDVATLVAWLQHFFDDTAKPDEIIGAKALPEDISLYEEIHTLRLSMVSRPSILVFSGIEVGQGALSMVEHQIADSDVLRFIARLISDLPICSCDDPELLKKWRSNRVVLLSDESIAEQLFGRGSVGTDYREVPQPENWTSLEFKLPRNLWLEEPSRLNLENSTSLKKALKKLDHQDSWRSESALHLMSAIDRIRGRHVQRQELSIGRSSSAKICRQLTSLWLDAIKSVSNDANAFSNTDVALNSNITNLYGLTSDDYNLKQKNQTHDSSVDLALLQLIAIVPEGVRRTSLVRMVARLRSTNENLLPELQVDDLDRRINLLLERYPQLVSENHSDGVKSIDESAHYLELDFDLSVVNKDRHHAITDRTIHFVHIEVRYGVLEWMGYGNFDRYNFHRLHRMLAEDATQQISVVLRNFDASLSPSLRTWRRLLSMFYHGLLSLDLCVTDGRLRLEHPKADSSVGQDEAEDLWMWLYGFGLRRMIERAPAHNLTRYYGADSLKRNLLMELFDDPATYWPSGYRVEAGLTGEEARQRVNRDDPDLRLLPENLSLVRCVANRLPGVGLEAEYWKSLARVCLSLGDNDGVEQALARIESLPAVSAGFRSESAKKLDCKKLELDSITLGLELEIERTYYVSKLIEDSLGDMYSTLEQEISMVREQLHKLIVSEQEPSAQRSHNTNIPLHIAFKSTKKIVSHCIDHGWSTDEMSSLVDLIYRIASLQGVWTLLEETMGSEDLPMKQASMLQPVGTRVSGTEPTAGYVASLSIFLLAEQLRLQIFRLEPLGSRYFASGEVMRQMIRVALELEGIVINKREELEETRYEMSPFGRLARLQADRLTRHLFRYPREQASMLLIEAEILRTQSLNPTTRLARLIQARALCAKAEPIVFGLGRELRLRLRLVITRLKIHRDLVLGGMDPDGRFESFWEADVRFLQKHPIASRFGYWSRRATQSVENFELYIKSK